MPKGYEKMRDKFIADGMDPARARKKAARIWNSKHKTKVTGAGEYRDMRIEKALTRGEEGGGSNRRRKGTRYE